MGKWPCYNSAAGSWHTKKLYSRLLLKLNFHSNSLRFLGTVLKSTYFLSIMHKVKAERSGELFVKNMLILQRHFAMLDLETSD